MYLVEATSRKSIKLQVPVDFSFQNIGEDDFAWRHRRYDYDNIIVAA